MVSVSSSQRGRKKKGSNVYKISTLEESKFKNVCVTDHQEILSVFCSFWEHGVIINEFFKGLRFVS